MPSRRGYPWSRGSSTPRGFPCARSRPLAARAQRRCGPSPSAFCGQLALGWIILDPGDCQAKGALERSHRFVHGNFEAGRLFASPLDFQLQLDQWADKINARKHRGTRAVVSERLVAERRRMVTYVGDLKLAEQILGGRRRPVGAQADAQPGLGRLVDRSRVAVEGALRPEWRYPNNGRSVDVPGKEGAP